MFEVIALPAFVFGEPGQLSLAEGEAGQLSLPAEEEGRLSLPPQGG